VGQGVRVGWIGHLALDGMPRRGDGGTAAHLFQLLKAAQLSIMAFFAIRWLPHEQETEADTDVRASLSGATAGLTRSDGEVLLDVRTHPEP